MIKPGNKVNVPHNMINNKITKMCDYDGLHFCWFILYETQNCPLKL